MSNSTSIQWTDVTDNIIVVEGGGWWCRKISEGCVNCYAAKLNQSDFFGGNKLPYSGKPPALILRTDIIDSWKRQRKPKKHFVCSMTDIFGEWVDQEMANTFLDGMCVQGHVFQLLTKRPEIMRDRVNGWLKARGYHSPPRSIWLGVSVEDQKRADERIPILLSIPAAVRFLSAEPLLEQIDLSLYLGWRADHEARALTSPILQNALRSLKDVPGVDWIIVGGESGKNARLCHAQWIRQIVRQCEQSHVPAFVKQMGSNVHEFAEYAFCNDPKAWCHPKWVGAPGDCIVRLLLKDGKGGEMSEWPADLRVREFPKV